MGSTWISFQLDQTDLIEPSVRLKYKKILLFCLFENQTPVQKVFGQGNKDPKNFIWAGEGGVQHSQKAEISQKKIYWFKEKIWKSQQ